MITQFQEQLASLGYEVKETTTNSPLLSNLQLCYKDKIVHALYASKTTGVGRRDCNAGYVVIRENGDVEFDFFVGGCKYGIHKSSFVPHPSFEHWSKYLPVEKLLEFLY